MKKFSIKVSALLCAVFMICTALAGCDPGKQTKPKIGPAPEVKISSEGVAVWNEVADALYYAYTIDDGAETPTADRRVQLGDGQTIRVKAVSGKEGYDDSDFSAPQTYRAGAAEPEHTEHSDVDSNGVCDVCGESVTAELAFYAVNDLHGKFMDSDTQPGVDEFTTYLKSLYQDRGREEILLSSGDMWQGTVESSSNKGSLMTEWMNEAGFVSMTLGNHEFDWGSDVLLPNSELAEFPFLAINVTENGKPVDYCRASTTVERGGVKIGIIGAIGDCLGSISGEFSAGLSFATGNALTDLVKAEATRLRTEEGCGFIVYSIHDGGSGFSPSGVSSVKNSDIGWYDTSLSDGYVDLVFEGHTHQRYILQDEYGVYHMQAASENRYLGCAEVSYNTVTDEFTVTPSLINANEYANSKLEDDPSVGELFEKYFPDSDPYAALGYNRVYRDSETIEELAARLYYEKGVEVWGDEYEIVLGGGYLKTRNPYDLAAGNVAYADLYSLLPFDNDIVLGRIRGSDLKSKFLNSASSSYHVYSTVTSDSIVNGTYYYIVVDTYTAYYKRNNITEVQRIGGVYARDLLADYIKAGNWA